MIKKRYLFIIFTIISILVIVTYYNLPVDLSNYTNTISDENFYIIDNEKYVAKPLVTNSQESKISRSWLNYDAPTSKTIVQNNYVYKDFIESGINFQLKKAQHLSSSKWPNFYSKENLYPAENYVNLNLGNVFVVCDIDTQDNCQRWFALYTKNNFLYEVVLFSINDGISYKEFYRLLDLFIENN